MKPPAELIEKVCGSIDAANAPPCRAIPEGFNFLILLAQLLGILLCFFLCSLPLKWWSLLLLSTGFGLLMNSVYSIIHEAEHGMLFADRRANDFAGALMAVFFPAPFHLIRQGHLGHHLRNRSDDEAFDLYFDEDHWWWRALALYGILTGFYWLMVALSNVVFLFFPYSRQKEFLGIDRPSSAFFSSLNPAYTRWIQCECLAVLTIHSLLVYSLGVPIFQYAAMYAGFGFMWSAMQYVHHYGTERHVTRGARNLWIFGPLDRFWLHHNWHLTHHEHPTVPWIYLPTLGSKEDSARGFLPTAYLRMWRGPRKATERVENKYAGRIVT